MGKFIGIYLYFEQLKVEHLIKKHSTLEKKYMVNLLYLIHFLLVKIYLKNI